jgi:hypothetical protein
MSFNMDIDLNTVEEVSGGAIPAGEYPAQIEEAELKDTKDGTGKYIRTQWSITGDTHANRKFWFNFNIVNKNDQAVRIGLGNLKSMIIASGATTTKVTDASQIVGLECLVKLKVVTDSYGESNEVTTFKKLKGDVLPEGVQAEIPKGADGKPVF